MKRFVIGIDLDDVLADFMVRFMELARKRYGRPPVGAMPVDWEWSNILPSKEEQATVWEDVKATPSFWENLPIEPGVTKQYVQLLELKHTMYYPTARVDTVGLPAAKQSARWIERKFDVQNPAVFAAYEKGPMATALKYDFFIDDRPKNCLDIQKALPNCRVYLKDSSHNQAFDAEANGIVRVKDFDSFARIVLEEEK